jgi:hypothetical protein
MLGVLGSDTDTLHTCCLSRTRSETTANWWADMEKRDLGKLRNIGRLIMGHTVLF